MEPADVKVDTCIDYDVEHNRKEPKFKIWGHERISKIFLRRAALPIGPKMFL